MDIPKIDVMQKHFKITTKEAELTIPKNETSSAIIEVITPHLEKIKNNHNQLNPQIISQLHNVLKLIQMIKDSQSQLNEKSFNEMMLRLEETYYFIYDLLKLMEIEIPSNFFSSYKNTPF